MLSSDAVFNAPTNTQVTTPPTLIYAAEMDGSVIAYRQQGSLPTTLKWVPQASDNLNMVNVAGGSVGSASNPFNNRIEPITTTVAARRSSRGFNLTGADGSVRMFTVEAFSVTGSTGVTRVRPYLQKWTDNRGNYYTFDFGHASTATDYGQVNLIKSSNGDYVRFSYDTFGHIIKAYTGDGRILYYQYDNYGDLTQVTLPDASTISYDYQHVTATATSGTAVAGSGTLGGTPIIASDNNLGDNLRDQFRCEHHYHRFAPWPAGRANCHHQWCDGHHGH